MLPPLVSLFVLAGLGAGATILFAPRIARMTPAGFARGYRIAVTVLVACRIAAWMAARVFGLSAMRPFTTVPYDLTNLLIGVLLGLALVHLRRGSLAEHLRAPDVQLALCVANGAAFLLAGLGGAFVLQETGQSYFVAVGYPKTFHLLIITAEVMGGAALLLPWRWLTLAVVAGLTVDMFGAIYTMAWKPGVFDAAAFTMLCRLCPLALVIADAPWRAVSLAALGCGGVAVAGSHLLR